MDEELAFDAYNRSHVPSQTQPIKSVEIVLLPQLATVT